MDNLVNRTAGSRLSESLDVFAACYSYIIEVVSLGIMANFDSPAHSCLKKTRQQQVISVPSLHDECVCAVSHLYRTTVSRVRLPLPR